MKNIFICKNCKKEVKVSGFLGTLQRNHCPYCLWSLHVDEKPGDRKSFCRGKMRPIGLTFKNEGVDKYGKQKTGELMLVHECNFCQHISINRLAGDDDSQMIMDIFNESREISSETKKLLNATKIFPLEEKDRPELEKQLFGQK